MQQFGYSSHVPAAGQSCNTATWVGQSNREQGIVVKIRFVLNGTLVTGRLDDNATSRDFVAMLPLPLRLVDFAATEKIAYLPRRLNTDGTPSGIVPYAGDVTYYEPWGNIAVFHKDFRHSPGLVKLGRLDCGLEELRTTGASDILIERTDD
ncbi:hypothetical protein NK8_63650 (plasmid) [Caballeronia sp. NK8]|nr:hypothetical protein NK8_63650 [Caballeronia sp. NK8]